MESTSGDAGTSWLDGLVALAVLLLAGLLGLVVVPARYTDVWQHLATGRLIAQGQYQFGADPFCYTTANELWVNHSWGYDVGLYWLYDSFGAAGVIAIRAAISLFVVLVLMSI